MNHECVRCGSVWESAIGAGRCCLSQPGAAATPQGTTAEGANSRQVGGSHYKTPIEPWDFVAANSLGYFEGSVIKYITRWRKKGGMQDLEKAKHYLEKLMEIERAANP